MNDKNKFQNKKEIKSILTYRNHNKNLDSIINVDKKNHFLLILFLQLNHIIQVKYNQNLEINL